MIKTGCALLLIGILLGGCSDSKEETEKRTSPRIKKTTKIESPVQNQEFTRGASIPVAIVSNSDTPIDSIEITINEETMVYTEPSFSISLPGKQVGTWQIRVKVFCEDQSETHYRKVVILPENAPLEMTYTVENSYPHNTEDYTQGLLIHEGFLYESNGQRGQSTLKKKNLLSGESIKTVNLASNLFGEGLALLNNTFYQLTWTSGKVFLYDMELNQTGTLSNQTEGWGITSIGNQLVYTDETEKLYFVDPASFGLLKELEVYDNEGKVDSTNELEVIDGLIYANVYQEDFVVVIDPETGEVLQKIDFSGLLTEQEAKNADVLNGIAVNPENGKIYVTGKLWPKLFEVTIKPKTIQ